MDFLFISTHELSALSGLPHLQRLTYILGIRPYMDRKTSVVGVKRRISYQSLAETLYVEPHPGIKSGSPSRQQLRRAIKGLEQAGLVQIQSTEKHLILKCLLADENHYVPNQPDTKPASYPGLIIEQQKSNLSVTYPKTIHHLNISPTVKADIPHNSEDIIVCLSKNFEKFWNIYPRRHNKQKAWEEFKKLNPDELLFAQIMAALTKQIDHYQQLQANGVWVPHWKYPDNWLAQQSWNDELLTNNKTERLNAKSETDYRKKSSINILWDSCKGGADFDFDHEESEQDIEGQNVLSFRRE